MSETTKAVYTRLIAVKTMGKILERGQTLDQALFQSKDYSSLSERDKAFTYLILLTTLRRLGEIDAVISSFMKKKLKASKVQALQILRITTAQILFLNTPPYAAVSSAVDLAGSDHSISALKGLINAVLRRVVLQGDEMLKKFDRDRLNTPSWLWEKLTLSYGETVTRQICQASKNEVPLDLTLKNPLDTQLWAKRLGAVILPNNSLRLIRSGHIEKLCGFNDGEWWVQDAAASLPVKMLESLAGEEVIDLCAAPGGKTAQLASAGAKVISIEQSGDRANRLSKNLKRVSLKHTLIINDAQSWRPKKQVNKILLDAPCSATGTIRRHPEVAWTRDTKNLANFTTKQDTLLDAAIEMLSPGGKLVYAVCSLLPEEGIERIEALLERNPGITRANYNHKNLGAPSNSITQQKDLRTLPSQWPEFGGLDGFYAACLQRRY